MLLKIPIYTLTQGMQLVLFSLENYFTIKQDVGISRILKNTRIYFRVQETTIEKTTKIYVIIYNKNKPLNHAFHNKT